MPAGAFVLLKPSLFPFALVGVNRRSWWAGAAAFVLLALLFAPMWPDFLAVLANSRGGGLLYSVQEVPMMAAPVLAWLGRQR